MATKQETRNWAAGEPYTREAIQVQLYPILNPAGENVCCVVPMNGDAAMQVMSICEALNRPTLAETKANHDAVAMALTVLESAEITPPNVTLAASGIVVGIPHTDAGFARRYPLADRIRRALNERARSYAQEDDARREQVAELHDLIRLMAFGRYHEMNERQHALYDAITQGILPGEPQQCKRQPCTCLGSCRGKEGLGAKWFCVRESVPVAAVEGTGEQSLVDVMTSPGGCVNSKSVARRMIEQGAIKVDGVRVKDASATVRPGQKITSHNGPPFGIEPAVPSPAPPAESGEKWGTAAERVARAKIGEQLTPVKINAEIEGVTLSAEFAASSGANLRRSLEILTEQFFGVASTSVLETTELGVS